MIQKKNMKRGIFVTSSPSHMKKFERHGSIEVKTSQKFRKDKCDKEKISKYSTNKLK
jgi:hypothetical protein